MTFRPMPILTALSVVSLVILVLLGNWQYARYSEKIDAPPIEEQVEERVLLRVLIDNANPGFAQQSMVLRIASPSGAAMCLARSKRPERP